MGLDWCSIFTKTSASLMFSVIDIVYITLFDDSRMAFWLYAGKDLKYLFLNYMPEIPVLLVK